VERATPHAGAKDDGSFSDVVEEVGVALRELVVQGVAVSLGLVVFGSSHAESHLSRDKKLHEIEDAS